METIPYDKRSGKIWYNGKNVDWAEAQVHLLSHGLHYASCVFEGVRVYEGEIFKLKEHTERLFYSAKRMSMNISYSVDEINKATREIVSIQKTKNGYIRPIIWRGSEIKLNISSWRKPSPNSIPWDTKASGLYMINTLSKHEAEAKGFIDSLMLDHQGDVAEATGANIFFKNTAGELHTPIPDSFLDGITRRCIIEIAKSKSIKVVERKIKPEEMSNFVGCFLTGSAAEITPVASIDKYDFKVCDVITGLSESYQGLVRKKKNAA